MLKETETKETIDFFEIFVIGGISIGGERASWAYRRSQGPPTEMTPMIKMSQKSLLCLQFRFLLGSLRTAVHVYNST